MKRSGFGMSLARPDLKKRLDRFWVCILAYVKILLYIQSETNVWNAPIILETTSTIFMIFGGYVIRSIFKWYSRCCHIFRFSENITFVISKSNMSWKLLHLGIGNINKVIIFSEKWKLPLENRPHYKSPTKQISQIYKPFPK